MKTLVCRCEDVTLDDVKDAFAKGHRDVESLKRYTGFATGYCQGKSCLVACARLVAEQPSDVAVTPVTPRPPMFPTPLAFFASAPAEADDASAPAEADDASAPAEAGDASAPAEAGDDDEGASR